jgi:hypothetical protein
MKGRNNSVFLIDDFIMEIKNILNFLKGKKTYFIAILVGLVAVAQYLGFIDNTVAVVLYGLLGATGTATLRAGIEKNK